MIRRNIRPIALFLLLSFLNQIIFPVAAYALTGGPSQPEVQSFEPVSTNQMVDLFTGDFNYNIPLVEVDGYPINIAYHSGITMDQEASWVGLGWNLNPGVINRNMRGLPDDFDGDEISKKTIQKTDRTGGLNVGAHFKLFGFPKIKLNGISSNLGINYNNYKGVGFEFGIAPSFQSTNKFKSTYSLSLTSSSQNGTDITPRIGFSPKNAQNNLVDNGKQMGVGLTVNSKQGLKSINMNVGYSRGVANLFSVQTYVPTIQHPMSNVSVGFTFKTGPEMVGFFPNVNISGYYAAQGLVNGGVLETKRKAFGALNMQNSLNYEDEALLDFNREKDGSFSVESPVLAIPQLTYDFYSFSGHGIGGTFRTFRGDIPLLYDPEVVSDSRPSPNIGLDMGFGNLAKYGVSVAYNYNKSRSGAWFGNKRRNILKTIGFNYYYTDPNNDPLYEPSYFKVTGEHVQCEENFFPFTNLKEPLQIRATPAFGSDFDRKNVYAFDEGNLLYLQGINGNNKKTIREKRSTYIKHLKNSDKKYRFEETLYSYPIITGPYGEGFVPNEVSINGNRKDHHTSEIDVVKPDGSKYIYGIAAYNTSQEEYSFACAKNIKNGVYEPYKNCESGTVTYSSGNFETEDREFHGNDKYFDKTVLPAYAHSYLLTDILSSDYVDVDMNGISPNDLGSYTKINYSRVNSGYHWRVPYGEVQANYNEGLKSDIYDDRANFIYGQKELWYVHSIVGKNHIALFYISQREDGLGVIDTHGGKNSSDRNFKLDSIALFSWLDMVNPIKKVYFEYDYSLCPNVENNSNVSKTVNGININASKGKLTLKKIYFTYGNSFKGKYNSYGFDYNYGNNSAYNPDYSFKGYDRWGYYKPASMEISGDNINTGPCDTKHSLLATEFPFVEQDKELADKYTSAWHLTQIILPSGGKINLEYESDDYAYVQDKNAMEMYRLFGFSNSYNGNITNYLYDDDSKDNFSYIFFKIDNNITNEEEFKTLVKRNLNNNIYYNVMVNVDNKVAYENIRGYAEPEDFGIRDLSTGEHLGWVKLKEPEVKGKNYNPISLSTWDFTKINLPQLINPGSEMRKTNPDISDGFVELGKTLVGFVPDIIELIKGGYPKLRKREFARETVPGKSWIRLNDLSGFKLGGGNRVKRISMSDNWSQLEGSSSSRTEEYGQEFDYTIIESKGAFAGKVISSGVASYEPLVGGEENPFRQPKYYTREHTLIPDERLYSEEPFGESFFPSPIVGYSKVTVKNIGNVSSELLSRNGTGKIVNEFYTAKDFPTYAVYSKADVIEKTPCFIYSLFLQNIEKSLTMTQSYLIELNDMHGRPKAVWNYSQEAIISNDIKDASSGITYEYYEESNEGKRRLNNNVNVIYPNNVVGKANIGVEVDAFGDSRQFTTNSYSGGIDFNGDAFLLSILPGLYLSAFPQINSESTEFNSGVSVKVVNRYGILKAVTAFEEGASLRTENTHFDSETGEVLITKTQNEYKDNIYNTTYPAHWVYEGMGPAYKNTNAKFQIVYSNSSNAGFKVKVNNVEYNPEKYLVVGDIIELTDQNGEIYPGKLWVHTNDLEKWVFLDQYGYVVELTPNQTYFAKVIESGRKNMQSFPVANITSLKNPVISNSLNQPDSILNVQISEFDSKWKNNICYLDINTAEQKNLLKESLNIFNYLIKSGKISNLGNEFNWTGGQTSDPNYNISSIPIDTLFENDFTFNNSVYKRAYLDCYNNNNYTFTRHAIKHYNYGRTYRYGFVLPTITCTDGCITKILSLQLHISFTVDTVAKYDTLELSHLTVSNLPTDINVINPTGLAGIMYYKNGMVASPVSVSPVGGWTITSSCLSKNRAIQNPYLTGLRNNWKVKRNWTYLEKRIPESNQTNIRRDGTFKTYNNFWIYDNNRWGKTTNLNNWQFSKEISNYSKGGAESEARNPLNVFNSTIYENTTNLPIATVNNSKSNQVYLQNFEKSVSHNNSTENKIKCPTCNNVYELVNNKFDTNYFHSGKNSYKITQNTVLTNTYTYQADKVYSNGQYYYKPDTSDFFGVFEPDTGKYIVNAWVKVGTNQLNKDYSGSSIRIVLSEGSPITTSIPSLSSNLQFNLSPSGPIIDGWQRIDGSIYIGTSIKSLSISLIPAPSQTTYFDDLRIHPFNALMKSYVYDPKTLKLSAELDENNYATFYEYDKSGELVRVKKETEKGIATIKESRKGIIKN